MPIDKRKFKTSAYLASGYYILVILIAVLQLVTGIRHGDLPTTTVVNSSADIFAMVLGYVLFVCCVLDMSKNEENLNYFLFLLFTCFNMTFLDEVAWLIDGDKSLEIWNLIVNTIYYMCAPTLAYLFWKYVITYLNLDYEKLNLWDRGLFIGYLAAVAIRLINIPFGFYFSIRDDGKYTRGSLYILSNLYPYVIMILTLALIYVFRKRFKKYQIITLYMYALIPLIVGIVTIFTFGLSLSGPIIMMVFLLMYCVLNTVQSRERSISENELQMATVIQENMLPHIFPPYPHKTEFDLYASMTPAKEVGGDFYDFYLADDDHLVITIADVSGKGIPAALFMMVTKTLLKNRGLTDYTECHKMLERVNDQLCEGNELDMFVTAWVGVLTLSTGELRYANAGHEYPAIKKGGSGFRLVKDRHSPPLGAMEGITYREQRATLKPGDVIYLYTDGVTEATNGHKEFFGEDRMMEALNRAFDGSVERLDENVRSEIDAFTEGSDQFDDITMLTLLYNGPKKEN